LAKRHTGLAKLELKCFELIKTVYKLQPKITNATKPAKQTSFNRIDYSLSDCHGSLGQQSGFDVWGSNRKDFLFVSIR